MLENFSGATRIYPVVGNPIAQVKAPYGVTQAFEARGVDAICYPMQVAAEDFRAFITTMRQVKNCDGIIVTVPHKLTAFEVCDTVSERARFLRTVNCIRRTADGRLHGDMFDGLGFVAACKGNGFTFKGARALLVGAGGAGTAVAHAIATAGVAALCIAELDAGRRDELVSRFASVGLPVKAAELPDPTGFDIICNATPLGMRAGDPLPFDASKLTARMCVGDVVTKPEVPPLILQARLAGCKTSTGVDMFAKVRDLMIDFLLAPSEKI